LLPGQWSSTLSPDDVAAGIIIEEDFEANALIIRFEDGLLFAPGRSDMQQPARNALNSVAPLLLAYHEDGHRIVIEGHTDNIPHNPSNRYLSGARAATVAEYLRSQWGFDPRGIIAQGMGEYWPIAANDTPEGRSSNRRVEIRVYATQTFTANSNGGIPVA